ncbi:unnamed protein product, partial [Darwinula stevensoni]
IQQCKPWPEVTQESYLNDGTKTSRDEDKVGPWSPIIHFYLLLHLLIQNNILQQRIWQRQTNYTKYTSIFPLASRQKPHITWLVAGRVPTSHVITGRPPSAIELSPDDVVCSGTTVATYLLAAYHSNQSASSYSTPGSHPGIHLIAASYNIQQSSMASYYRVRFYKENLEKPKSTPAAHVEQSCVTDGSDINGLGCIQTSSVNQCLKLKEGDGWILTFHVMALVVIFNLELEIERLLAIATTQRSWEVAPFSMTSITPILTPPLDHLWCFLLHLWSEVVQGDTRFFTSRRDGTGHLPWTRCFPISSLISFFIPFSISIPFFTDMQFLNLQPRIILLSFFFKVLPFVYFLDSNSLLGKNTYFNMATYQADPLKTCPYNPSHQVRHDKFQLHIQKCRKQHPNAPHKKCVFNSTHIIPEVEMDYHLAHCSDRINYDRQVFQVKHRTDYGNQEAEEQEDEMQSGFRESSRNHVKHETGEDWESDLQPVTYDPSKKIRSTPILVKHQGGTKAVNAQMRRDNREQYQMLLNSVSGERSINSSLPVGMPTVSTSRNTTRISPTSHGFSAATGAAAGPPAMPREPRVQYHSTDGADDDDVRLPKSRGRIAANIYKAAEGARLTADTEFDVNRILSQNLGRGMAARPLAAARGPPPGFAAPAPIIAQPSPAILGRGRGMPTASCDQSHMSTSAVGVSRPSTLTGVSAAAPSPDPVDISGAEEHPERQVILLRREIRNLTKKLSEIASLVKRQEDGMDLQDEEVMKIGRERELQRKLRKAKEELEAKGGEVESSPLGQQNLDD